MLINLRTKLLKQGLEYLYAHHSKSLGLPGLAAGHFKHIVSSPAVKAIALTFADLNKTGPQ